MKQIDNAIVVQIGKYTFVVQGKRLTETKKRELYVVISRVLARLGVIKCAKTLDPRPYIKMINDWAVKGTLELLENRTARLGDIQIDNLDDVYYSSRITVRIKAVQA